MWGSMSLQEEIVLLRNIPLFSKVEASKLKLIAFTSEQVEFKAGEFLCHQGDEGKIAYILMKGSARVTIDTIDGPLHVNELGENDIFGEISLLCDVPRTATVQAITDVVSLCISKELFFRLLEEFPQVGIELMREMAHRLEITTNRLREVAQSK